MITATRVDRHYNVTSCPDIADAGPSRIRPDRVHIVYYLDPPGMGVSVYVRGPIVRKDWTLSARSAAVIYGTFGIPVEQAPDWVQNLAAVRP